LKAIIDRNGGKMSNGQKYDLENMQKEKDRLIIKRDVIKEQIKGK